MVMVMGLLEEQKTENTRKDNRQQHEQNRPILIDKSFPPVPLCVRVCVYLFVQWKMDKRIARTHPPQKDAHMKTFGIGSVIYSTARTTNDIFECGWNFLIPFSDRVSRSTEHIWGELLSRSCFRVLNISHI